MVDANQAWDLATVRDIAPGIAAVDPAWLEEPLHVEDLAGYADLADLGLPIAAGESVFTAPWLRRLVDGCAIAVLTPDLQRLGGLTGWRHAVDGVRDCVGQVCSHLYPEFSIHLLAAEPRPAPLEWVDWNRAFVSPPTVPRGGVIEVPQERGFGLEYDWEAVRHFTVA